jgi:hypothetical protein
MPTETTGAGITEDRPAGGGVEGDAAPGRGTVSEAAGAGAGAAGPGATADADAAAAAGAVGAPSTGAVGSGGADATGGLDEPIDTTGAGATLVGLQAGGRVDGGGADDDDDGLESAAFCPKPGKERTGSPRQFFHASVAMGARTGRLTNMWSKIAI